MYAMEVEGQEYLIKPMNCPFHIAIHQPVALPTCPSVGRSWGRCTVMNVAESCMDSTVRGFTQDDAHIFCRPDQMPEEIDRTRPLFGY